jgi:hypothetical protein
MSKEMSSHFDVKLAVKRVAYFQTVCPDFIIVLYFKPISLDVGQKTSIFTFRPEASAIYTISSP